MILTTYKSWDDPPSRGPSCRSGLSLPQRGNVYYPSGSIKNGIPIPSMGRLYMNLRVLLLISLWCKCREICQSHGWYGDWKPSVLGPPCLCHNSIYHLSIDLTVTHPQANLFFRVFFRPESCFCLEIISLSQWTLKKKSLNFIFPTKYVIPKRLKFSHWPSKSY